MKVVEKNAENITREALALNFWRKQLRDSKLTVCESIVRNLELQGVELGPLADWLDENKPAPEHKATPKRTSKPAADTMLGTATRQRMETEVLPGQTFIVTGAQNNTEVAPVFDQLKALADYMDAVLVVLPVYYNKNAFSPAAESSKEYFAPDVLPYLQLENAWLGGYNGCLLASEAAVLPTAKQPVNAAATLNAGEAATVVPSPKQDMQQIAVMLGQGDALRQAWTTGICTQYNYTRSRAGAEAEAAHKFGGLIIRATENTVRIENIYQGSDGSLVTWEQCADNAIPVDVVLGDLHCEMEDPEVTEATQYWLGGQNVRNLAAHDVLHFATASHHNRKSAKHNYSMLAAGCNVAKDLQQVAQVLNSYANLADRVYLVESNHNSAIDNWLDDTSAYANDSNNSKLWCLLNYGIRDAIDNGVTFTGGLELALSDAYDYAYSLGITLHDNIEFGHKHISETWEGVEVSQHGHKGQNGSFGSTQLFGRSGKCMVTGHTHSPAIRGLAFTVGVTASLDQFYNRGGLSSWNHANAVILPNGTVQLVTLNPLTF